MILNIETSSKICSVALCHAGEVNFNLESEVEMQHSALLPSYVEKCMEFLERKEIKLDAVSVSLGPGSYTGLRIGLSLAKGLCFSKKLPIIGISTLKILAVKAMFKNINWEGTELFVPLIDARRMEVYTAVYDFRLQEILKPMPLILEPDSFEELAKNRKLIFVGDAVDKAKDILQIQNACWIDTYPLATDMNVLSEKDFIENNFMDLAYSIPEYLKNFQPTVPRCRF